MQRSFRGEDQEGNLEWYSGLVLFNSSSPKSTVSARGASSGLSRRDAFGTDRESRCLLHAAETGPASGLAGMPARLASSFGGRLWRTKSKMFVVALTGIEPVF